jgi:hypothetical protein
MDAEGIQRYHGQLAAVRVTRRDSVEFGWECEITVGGRRDGRRRMAEWYMAAEIAEDSNCITRLRAWRASEVRPLLTGGSWADQHFRDVRAATGGRHGLVLSLRDAEVTSRATDLTQLLADLERKQQATRRTD